MVNCSQPPILFGEGGFLVIEADLSKPNDIERLIATTLDAFGGRLDVLVNNASTIGPSPMPYLLDYPLEDFRNVLNTNLIGPFLITKGALPAMIENGGSIINVSSDAGSTGYPGWGAYGISKFGVEGMSQTWASELEDTDVRVNWVDPGNMNTAMHRAAEPEEDPSEWADPGGGDGRLRFSRERRIEEDHGKAISSAGRLESGPQVVKVALRSG